MPTSRQPSSTPDAVRMRRWRASTGQTPSARVDLAALGAYLESLPEVYARRFAAMVGEEVAERARAATRRPATDMVRPVAG